MQGIFRLTYLYRRKRKTSKVEPSFAYIFYLNNFIAVCAIAVLCFTSKRMTCTDINHFGQLFNSQRRVPGFTGCSECEFTLMCIEASVPVTGAVYS